MTGRSLVVRGRPVMGSGAEAYVIAEIGTNHNRDFDTAVRMLRALAETGCDCAKFQIYEPEEIVSARVRVSDYGLARWYGDISAREMFERHLKTPKAWFPALRDLCHDLGMDFAATIHGSDGLRWAQATGLDIVKVASMDHTNLPLLHSLVDAVDAPILWSVGMATLDAIDAADEILRHHSPGVGLFHCCALYPAPIADLRLQNVAFLAHRYGHPTGFSDHTLDGQAAIEARRLGAVMFEKHVTFDRRQPGPDHGFALEMTAFREYVDAIKATPVDPPAEVPAFAAPGPAEQENGRLALKSILARRDLPAGHVVTAEDVYMARPGTGLSPARLGSVIGKRLVRAVEEDVPLQSSDIDGAQT